MFSLQKLWTRKVGPLALTGGMAEDLVCIVTGPTSGIGKEIAKELARRGAQGKQAIDRLTKPKSGICKRVLYSYAWLLLLERKPLVTKSSIMSFAVILACRSMDKGNLLCKEIHQEAEEAGGAPPRVQAMQLDLSSLASVQAFAQAWEQSSRPIHVLINNAGIFSMASPRSETMDGLEAHIGTNHLGHFLLTLLLMPYLKAGSLGLGRPARVVNVASRLHLMCGKINKDDPHMSTRYVSLQAYAQSKLAQVAFAAELTLRTKGEVIGVAVHPGEVTTDVVRSLPMFLQKLYKLIMGMILLTPSQGEPC